MKVVCIENRIFNHQEVNGDFSFPTFSLKEDLTIGKVYDVISELPQCFKMINDRGETSEYLKVRFIPLEEHRENILNNLNIK
jgi:hypothetical protein